MPDRNGPAATGKRRQEIRSFPWQIVYGRGTPEQTTKGGQEISEEDIMRTIALILAFCISAAATAFQPRIGLWGNLEESGSGYMFDIQNGTLVVTSYSYQASGPDQWYLSSGPLTNNGHNFTATLDKYQGGQCISCTYRAPTLQGNDGTITITFVSETMANLSLPGGRTTVIQAFDFGYGPLPNGLLGEWVFVYELGSTAVAELFDFTTTATGTASGTGMAVDATRGAGCELQVSGSLSGMVLCGVMNASGSIDHLYTFRYGLDQTFSGMWLTHTQTAKMKGYRLASKSGITNAGVVPSPGERIHALEADASTVGTAVTMESSGSSSDFAELAQALRSLLSASRQ